MRIEAEHVRRIPEEQVVHIGFTADVHTRAKRQRLARVEVVRDLIEQMTSEAMIGVIAGDHTDHGFADEAKKLCQIIANYSVKSIPWFYTDGNHDNESGQADILEKIYKDEIGMRKLQGTIYVHNQNGRDIGLTGVRGLGGGFGRGRLHAFGDPEQKVYIEATIREAKQLGNALKQLKRKGVEHVAAFTHYGSSLATIQGREPPELNFIGGCEIFGEVADKYKNIVDVLVHGHMHQGNIFGMTPGGIPVYNVAFPQLLKQFPDHPFLLYSI